MRPETSVDQIHGLLLSGGSSFGLAAADGVVRYLREQGYGYRMPHGVIPLVPAGVIYDLDQNRQPGVLPDASMGYRAAQAASSDPVAMGRVGAGVGARCGRMFGGAVAAYDATAPGGTGSALVERQGIQVAALAVVNTLGNIHHPETHAFLAGGRDALGEPFSAEAMYTALAGETLPTQNTILTVVATNVPLNKLQTTRLARMAASGLARVIYPAHMAFDGDIVFALASKAPLVSGSGAWTESLLGAMGAEAVAAAVVQGVLHGARGETSV